MAMHLPLWVLEELGQLDLPYGRVELVLHDGQVVQLIVKRTELIKGPKQAVERPKPSE